MVNELTLENYKELTSGGKLTIIDFWASFCNPCKVFKQVFEKTSEEYEDVQFCTCDAEEYDDIVAEFGVRGVPTIVFLKNGEQVGRLNGAIGEEAFKEKINSLK